LGDWHSAVWCGWISRSRWIEDHRFDPLKVSPGVLPGSLDEPFEGFPPVKRIHIIGPGAPDFSLDEGA
jgi:hypothetical protein